MAIRNYLKDELQYILFSNIYDGLESPKAKRVALSIIRVAIDLYAKKGFFNVKMQHIAKEAELSLPTIYKYFKNTDSIQMIMIKYLRYMYQKYVVEEVSQGKTPQDMFTLYFDACFRWVEYFPKYASVWIQFLAYASTRAEFKIMNSEMTQVGLSRLEALIQLNISQESSHKEHAQSIATTIHCAITGLLLKEATEKSEDTKKAREELKKNCLLLFAKS